MVFRPIHVLVAALPLLAAPAVAQEVLPAPAAPGSCSAGKLGTDMTLFLGPEDADAAPSRLAAAVEDDPNMAVGSLPAGIAAWPRRIEMATDLTGWARAAVEALRRNLNWARR